MSATVTRSRQSVYQIVTDRLVAALESGVIPWRRRWAGQQLMPRSATTGKHYRGVNVWLLAISAEIEGYESPWWVTYKQAQAMGGNVRKGEHGSLVTFWTEWDRETATGETQTLPVLRYFTVFNAEQCEGLGAKYTARPDVPEREHTPIEACERIVAGYVGGPTIEHGGYRACYRPSADLVSIPRPEVFQSAELYYATLFHELAHSTGHEKRLHRESLGTQAVDAYGREELTAEMAAALLCGIAEIEPATIDDHAAYIHGWCSKLRQDAKLAIQSAAAAQRAADHILGAQQSAAV